MSPRLFDRLSAAPPRGLFLDGPEPRSYAAVHQRCAQIRELAADAGLSPTDRVIVSTSNDPWLFDLFVAGLSGAFVPMIVSPEEPAPRRQELAKRAQVKAAFLDPGMTAPPFVDPGRTWRVPGTKPRTLLSRLLGRSESTGADDLLACTRDRPGSAPRPSEAQAEAYVLCSSGSTAQPKIIATPHRALDAHLQTLVRVMQFGPASRVMNLLPFDHADGLLHGALAVFVTGGTLLRPFRFEVGKVQDVVDELHRATATHLTAVPTMYSLIEALADDLEATFAGPDAPLCVSTAGPLDSALRERWAQRTGRPLAEVYGLTETVVGACFNGPPPLPYLSGSVGRAVDCELSIRSSDGGICEPGDVGEIWLRGEHVAATYLETSSPRSACDEDGWLHTGDLGRVDSEGACFIEGRLDDLIICGGENLSPQSVESLLRGHPGVREAFVYGTEDRHFSQVPHAVVAADDTVQAETLLHLLGEHLPPRHRPRSLRIVPSLPVGPSGKLLRAQARERFATASVPAADPTSNDLDVVALAASVFSTPASQMNLHDGPDSVEGWDSLGHMRLVAVAEAQTGAKLTPGEIVSIRTLRDLDRLLRASQSSR